MRSELKPICKLCDSPYHYQSFCRLKKKKGIKAFGKAAEEWSITRTEWFKANASHSRYYYCHYCGKPGVMEETTLDHKKPKGTHSRLTHDFSNLVPCCGPCNTLKGSRSYENFCRDFFPHLLK